MGHLDGKTALIFGLSNDRSIAWGITRALHREGAKLAFSCAPVMEKRARPLIEQVESDFLEFADAGSDGEIAAVFAKAKERYGSIDILVHSIG
jgi:enoyl-[acyl-carrier protein] reductase I